MTGSEPITVRVPCDQVARMSELKVRKLFRFFYFHKNIPIVLVVFAFYLIHPTIQFYIVHQYIRTPIYWYKIPYRICAPLPWASYLFPNISFHSFIYYFFTARLVHLKKNPCRKSCQILFLFFYLGRITFHTVSFEMKWKENIDFGFHDSRLTLSGSHFKKENWSNVNVNDITDIDFYYLSRDCTVV